MKMDAEVDTGQVGHPDFSFERGLVEAFVNWLVEHGYCRHTVTVYRAGAVRFLGWIMVHRLTLSDTSPETLQRYRRHLLKTRRLRPSVGRRLGDYSSARRMLVFLRDTGRVSPLEDVEPAVLAGFREWLRHHRGLSPLTVEAYVRNVRGFCLQVGFAPSDYKVTDLRSFVLLRTQHTSPSTGTAVVSALRAYLRYLACTGECSPLLENGLPRIAGWRLSSLPRFMQEKDVQCVLAKCNSSTPLECRDRAVVFLLARLALRSADVANLKLSDFDWVNARVRVTGKSRRECWMPLPQDVGNAVMEYLERGRPAVCSSAVFLSTLAPFGPMRSHVVSEIARRAIIRAGVASPSLGAHVFRHSAATTLLRHGVTLARIGALLRHDSVESVAHYAKVDLDLLRTVARPWPGRES